MLLPAGLVEVANLPPERLHLGGLAARPDLVGDARVTEEDGLLGHHVVLGGGVGFAVRGERGRVPLAQALLAERGTRRRRMTPEEQEARRPAGCDVLLLRHGTLGGGLLQGVGARHRDAERAQVGQAGASVCGHGGVVVPRVAERLRKRGERALELGRNAAEPQGGGGRQQGVGGKIDSGVRPAVVT